jgi:hypothetical protein
LASANAAAAAAAANAAGADEQSDASSDTEEIVALRETVRQLQQSQHEREVASSAAEFHALRARLDGAHLSLGRSSDLLTEKAYMKCTKIPPFSPNDDRQATAARLAVFDHHLNRLQLSFPVMGRLMSPGYSLLDDGAPEESVFYRLLYDHTAGAVQDLCRAYHGRGSEAYQAIVSRFKSEDVQAWCHDFAQLRDVLKWPAPGVSPANMLSRFAASDTLISPGGFRWSFRTCFWWR